MFISWKQVFSLINSCIFSTMGWKKHVIESHLSVFFYKQKFLLLYWLNLWRLEQWEWRLLKISRLVESKQSKAGNQMENALQGSGIKLRTTFLVCGPENNFRAQGLNFTDQLQQIPGNSNIQIILFCSVSTWREMWLSVQTPPYTVEPPGGKLATANVRILRILSGAMAQPLKYLKTVSKQRISRSWEDWRWRPGGTVER